MLFFKQYKHVVGILLFTISLLHASLRMSGDWNVFFSILLGQLLFANTVYGYLRGGWVGVGSGGLDKDADPEMRAAVAGICMCVYVLFFFLPF